MRRGRRRRRGKAGREWRDQGRRRRGAERGRGRMREPVNALVKCFLIELWKMAWKSSRIDME